MCGGGGGGPGGDVSVSDGANVVAGNNYGGAPSPPGAGPPGFGPGGTGTPGVGSGFGGYEGGATGAALGDAPVTGPGNISDMFSTQHLTKTDKTALPIVSAMMPIPLVGPILGGIVNAARGAGQPEGTLPTGDPTGPGGLGGPGDPIDFGQGLNNIDSYRGPISPPVTTVPGFSNLEPITPATIQTGSPFSVERGRSPSEIDAANRLRISREQAYAKQRADAEAELLKTLGLRDVAYTGGPDSRLATQPPASERFVGKPPGLGQSRHYWP